MDPSGNSQSLSKKVYLENEEDRISSLPDEVIAHILSFLGARKVVRTSVLSSRWENMWASVPNLDFCPMEMGCNRDDENYHLGYMSVIDRVLMLHNSSIFRFHVVCTLGIDAFRLNSWISLLLERNIREIEISNGYFLKITLPRRLFTSTSLVVLKISARVVNFDAPTSFYLPSLKVLRIRLLSPSHCFIEKLLCSCPLLEELYIRIEEYSEKILFSISSPLLKTLHIKIYSKEIQNLDNVVTIDAPTLKSLKVYDDCYVHYNLKNVSSLSNAYLDVDVTANLGPEFEDMIQLDALRMLLVAISHVKNLYLGPCTLDALSYNDEKEWPVLSNIQYLHVKIEDFFDPNNFSKWPKFPDVSHLVLDVFNFCSTDISNFLVVVPNLGTLVFKRVSLPNFEFRSGCSEQRVPTELSKTIGVPTCLQSCLKKIEVHGLEGSKCELKLIKYLLESAQVLEEITVECCKSKEVPKVEFQAKIIAIPRSSRVSQVVFV